GRPVQVRPPSREITAGSSVVAASATRTPVPGRMVGRTTVAPGGSWAERTVAMATAVERNLCMESLGRRAGQAENPSRYAPARMSPFLSPIDARIVEAPDRTALVCGGQRLSYAELGAAVTHLAARLAALGVVPGDRVAIHLPNSAEAVVAVLAAARAGAVFVIANAGLKTRKLVHVLADSGAR